MEKIETLSSIKGRKALISLFRELRYDKQLSSFSTLFLTWRICVKEKELYRYINKEIIIQHPLGFFSGTNLWMQEIVNRFYFSTINSFVYLGAAILLGLIGIKRFSNHISDTMVITGVALESFLLIMMFLLMLFTPNDEALEPNDENENSIEELIIEVGEVGRDLAASVSKLDDVNNSINELIHQQVNLINLVNQVAKHSADAISPNPQMLDIMRVTNVSLEEFKNTVDSFTKEANKIKKEEIAEAVKKEISSLVIKSLDNKV